MPPPDQKPLGLEILAKCATNENPLERGGCNLRLSASNIALVLNMDEDPVKSKIKDEGRRCDFAAYQRPSPVDGQAHLVLMEFKSKPRTVKPHTVKVNWVLGQLGSSLEFLARLADIPKFAFDSRTSVLVCEEEVGRRKTLRLQNARHVLRGGVTVRLRPLILISGDELTDKQIAENGQPWKPKAAKKRGKG